MARKRIALDQHRQAAEVLELFKGEPAGWRRERLLAITLGMENQWSTKEIAQTIGRGEATIYCWFKSFREGGLEKLLKKESGKGFAGALNEEQMEEFRAELEKGKWRTGGQAYAWLKEKFGITFHPNNIYKYLKKARWALEATAPQSSEKKPSQTREISRGAHAEAQ